MLITRSGEMANFRPFTLSTLLPRTRLHGTRMDLTHDDLGKLVKKGQTSDPLVYWVGCWRGEEKEAHALADTVAEIKDGD